MQPAHQRFYALINFLRGEPLKQTIRILYTSILVFGASFMAFADNTWSVGKADIQGRPVIYKFIDAMPPASTRQTLPWLTIISWKYDDSESYGMPSSETNRKMIEFEDTLEKLSDNNNAYLEVYSATGNNIKELAFYIADRKTFMANLNEVLRNKPYYPIDIKFYEDGDWSDLAKLQHNFALAR
ncbi:DUF695 domain-containing protein [Pseudomonas azotoformans]